MNRIKRFNEVNEEIVYQPNNDPDRNNPPSEESSNDDITVKDIIDYLSTLPPDATTSLDHDGWEYDGGGTTGLEIVKNSPLFWFDEKRNHLYINN